MDAGIPLLNGLPQFPGQIGPVNVQGDITATGNITAGGQLAGASGNITGNLTVGGNVTVTGTISASGLSDSAARNARAPRQGLVFDGTAGNTGTLASAIGTSDLSLDVIVTAPTAANFTGWGIFGIGSVGTANTFSVYVYGNDLYIAIYGATGSDYRSKLLVNFVPTYSGKTVKLTVVRNATTPSLAVYVDGIAQSLSENTGGTPPTWGGSINSTTFYHGKLAASGNYYTGYISAPNLYNRALSAAEIQSLYDAGAPSKTDYNSASNTALTAPTTFVPYLYDIFTGATASGFTAVETSGLSAQANTGNGFGIISPKGSKFRVTFNATLTSGSAPLIRIAKISVGVASSQYSVVNGSNDITITLDVDGLTAQTGTGAGQVRFDSSGNTSYSISNLNVYPLGLLLAPEIPAPGNGLVWNDQSGNGASIVLNTSGITWNLPSNGENRVRAQTNTNGNQQLLGTTCLPPYMQITQIRARSLSGTPNVKLGTSAGGNQVVTTVALSTAWKTLSNSLPDPTGSGAAALWANSNSTDTVQWDISWEPVAAL